MVRMNRLRAGFIEVDKAADDLADLIDVLAARFEPRIKAAFLRAMEDIRKRIDVAALRDAVDRSDHPAVLRILGLTEGGPLTRLVDPVRTTFIESAKAVSETRPGRLEVRFDMLEPRTVMLLRDYGLRLVSQVTEDTRAGVREVLARQLGEGVNPRGVATEVGRLVGLTANQVKTVRNYRRALEDLKGEALVRAFRDKRFDRTVARAIQEKAGLPAKVIDRLVERYRERMIRDRGETIARTESIRAANLANWAAMRQAIEQGKIEAGAVTRRWVVARDERTCPTCKAVPGLNAEGVGMMEAFRTPIGPVQHPPLHPKCRCAVTFRLKVD